MLFLTERIFSTSNSRESVSTIFAKRERKSVDNPGIVVVCLPSHFDRTRNANLRRSAGAVFEEVKVFVIT